MRAVVTALLSAAVLSAFATAAFAATDAQTGGATVQWLGANFYRFTTPSGKVVLANPFANNPDSPVKVEAIGRVDLILVTNGHGDELGQTVEIAKQTGARVISSFEISSWLVEQGVPQAQIVRFNPGARFRLDEVTIRAVESIHASSVPRPSATTPYGGLAMSYFLTIDDGWTIFYGGSSAATLDMGLWGSLYQPDAVILALPANGEPMDFAASARLLQTNNPNLATVLPGHTRAVPQAGQTTVEEAQAAIDALGLGLPILAPRVGEPYTFTR